MTDTAAPDPHDDEAERTLGPDSAARHRAATLATLPATEVETRPPSSGAGPEPFDTAPGGALPQGHRLHEFVIEETLGIGGFGIVYRARDQQLQRTVAIKEYMPSTLAVRRSDGSVGLRSERQRDTYELGLRSFVNEAQLLAAFEHPALLKVYRFWEQQGSAYMVMPCYEGLTLKAWLAQRKAPPGEAWWRPRLLALADALTMMHRERCYHRDIAPDNILLVGPTLQPVLLDFGAARRVVGDATQSLTVILKPGYAPIEQYAESPALKQGPWTDVYALCAVLHAAVTGRAPPPAVARMLHDERPSVRDWVAAQPPGADRPVYGEAFLEGIDAGLAVKPEDRPQDMPALIRRLGLAPKDTPPPTQPPSPLAAPAAVAAQEPAATPVRRGGRGLGLAAAGLGALLIGGGAWWLARAPGPGPTAAVAPAAATAAPASAPPVQVAPPAPAPRPPYSPVRVLEDLVARGDPAIAVQAIADRVRIGIGRDRLQFSVRAAIAGHVYVYLVGTEGRRVELLFPNAIDRDNRIERDQVLQLPRAAWRITAGGPPGIDHLAVLVSAAPRRIEATGARAAPGESLLAFDDTLARQLWAASDGRHSAFAGEADCQGIAPPCPGGYGATLLRIEEVALPAAGASR